MDDTTTRPATDPSMDLLGDLEQRLSALKQWQQDSQDQATAVERQADEVARERASIDAAAESLAQERAEAAQEQVRLDEARAEVDRERDAVAGERSAFEAERDGLASERSALDEARSTLDAERSAHGEEIERLRGEQEALAEARRGLEAEAGVAGENAETTERLRLRAEELDAKAEQLGHQATAVEARSADLNEREAGLERRAAELDKKSSELDAFREELETELQRLTTLETELNQRSSELDEAARRDAAEAGAAEASSAELEEISGKLEAQSAELADARAELHRRGEELTKLRDAVAAAEEAAVEAGSGVAMVTPAASAEGVDVEAMQAELDKRAHNLKRAKKKIMELQEQVRSASDMNGESAIFSTGEIDLGEVTSLRMKLEEREAQLAKAGAKLDERDREVNKLKVRVEELIKRGGRTGSAQDGDTPDHAARAIELDEQAAQVTADRNRVLERKAQLKTADALIQSRREKIRSYIADFRKNHGRAQPANPGTALDPKKVAKLEQERITLLEVKRFLQNSEADMVKRWALQKSFSLACTLVIAVAAAAAVSWTAAGVIAKPLYQSTLTLEVTPDAEGEDLPPGVWLRGYGERLLSDDVLQEVQNQLSQRNLRLAGSAEGLRSRLDGKLAASGEPPAVELTFTDPDPTLVTPVLDAVGRGLLIHHMATDRRAGRMQDSAKLTSEAVLRDKPVRDERLRWFGMILGGFAGLALLAAIPARLLAGRATPTLREGAVPELAVLDHPSPLVSEAMQAAEAAAGAEAGDEGDVIKPVFRF